MKNFIEDFICEFQNVCGCLIHTGMVLFILSLIFGAFVLAGYMVLYAVHVIKAVP